MRQLIINCDGGSRGNPGPAASAFVIQENGNTIHEEGVYLGVATNNVAEYQAVLGCLRWLSKEKLTDVSLNFILDSELVVKQLTGIY